MNIEIGHPDSHKCQTSLDGNWVVFTCPLCEDYERRVNRVTGEVKSMEGIKLPGNWKQMSNYEKEVFIQSVPKHHGTFIPVGLDTNLYNPN